MELGHCHGGWCDVLESVGSNTIKEVKEETGLDVVAKKIIAVQGRNKHNKPICVLKHIKMKIGKYNLTNKLHLSKNLFLNKLKYIKNQSELKSLL